MHVDEASKWRSIDFYVNDYIISTQSHDVELLKLFVASPKERQLFVFRASTTFYLSLVGRIIRTKDFHYAGWTVKGRRGLLDRQLTVDMLLSSSVVYY